MAPVITGGAHGGGQRLLGEGHAVGSGAAVLTAGPSLCT